MSMNKYEIICGILGFFCLLVFATGPTMILLYNKGDLFSHIVFFIALFGSPFFISSIRGQADIDTFIKNVIIGLVILFLAGLLKIAAPFDTFAMIGGMMIMATCVGKL